MYLLRTGLVISLLKEPNSSEQLFTNSVCDVARVANVNAMTDAMELARMDGHSTCIAGVQQALQSWSSASEFIPYFSPLTVSMLIGVHARTPGMLFEWVYELKTNTQFARENSGAHSSRVRAILGDWRYHIP